MTKRRRTSRRTRRYLNTDGLRNRTDTRMAFPDGSYGRESQWFFRILALSNAVFGFSLTLLVVNIGVPSGTSAADLGHSIVGLFPNFVAFVLTVFIVALYWYNHNSLFESLRGIDMPMIGLGLVYLALIALLPFPNELLGNYPTEPLSYVAFATLLTGLATVDTVMLAYAKRRNLTDPSIPLKTHRIDLLRGSITIVIFAASVPISFVLVEWTPICWLLLLAFDRALLRYG